MEPCCLTEVSDHGWLGLNEVDSETVKTKPRENFRGARSWRVHSLVCDVDNSQMKGDFLLTAVHRHDPVVKGQEHSIVMIILTDKGLSSAMV